jgi:endo-1,4-beta-xylanase
MKNYLLLPIIALLACGKPATSGTDSLKTAYDGAFMMGTALNEQIVTGSQPEVASLVTKHFNAITAENVLKAGPLRPTPDEWNWEPADAFVEFGEEHNMFIIGHTLVWHNQTPGWFFTDGDGNPNSSEQQIERMRSHIEVVAGRYAGRIHAWDVVNEVIDNDGSYRPTTWVNGVGDGDLLVKKAFEFASLYAPDAELYYNDFNAWRPAKRDGIMRLVRILQDAGIRIDGVGIQGHWGLNYPKNEYIEAAIDSFATLGVKVMITEMDLDVLPLTKEGQIIGTGMLHPQYELEEFEEYLDPYKDGLPDEVQAELSERYREIFEIFYGKKDKLDRVTFWGVHDPMSWKNGYPIANRTNFPLLFNRDLTPKPAVDVLLKLPDTQ